MQYQKTDKKFVAIINRKKPLHEILNALAHTSAGITSVISDPESTCFLNYMDGDGGSHPAISHHPFVILQADNSNQVRKARNAALELGLKVNSFVGQMFGVSAEDQLQKTAAAKGEDIDYVLAVLFGDAETMQQVTKKYSLFRASAASPQVA
ncbi:DUF2000 domain-containing protein [Prosthecobacter sp.]|uniref:DUF2000 domain-containing protein n=1 Tax=Prosthecobacter sp. TaxID=1965333 RepID=UPI0037831217